MKRKYLGIIGINTEVYVFDNGNLQLKYVVYDEGHQVVDLIAGTEDDALITQLKSDIKVV